MSKSTQVKIGNTIWKNPVTTGSGTFGSGLSMTEYVDLNKLGAITIKGTTLNPCNGNIPPRMVETRSAVLGSVGLENPGVDAVMRDIIPKVAKYDSVLIVNIGGNAVEEYGEVAARLDTSPDVDAIEINISCPNLKKGGLGFGTDPEMAEFCGENRIGKEKKHEKNGNCQAYPGRNRHYCHGQSCQRQRCGCADPVQRLSGTCHQCQNQKTGSRKYSGRHLRTFLKASEHASCLESIPGC